MTSSTEFERHIKQLNDSMTGMQRILYVGANYRISDYPDLTNKKWRCVYTTSRSPEVAATFSREDRQVRIIKSTIEYDSEETKLDGNNPMIIFLNGVIDEFNEIEEDEYERDDEIDSLLSILEKSLKDLLCELIIVGYNPEDKQDIDPRRIARIARHLGENQISIYGGEAGQNKHIQKMEDEGLLSFYPADLGEAFKKLVTSDEYTEYDEPEEPVRDVENLQNCVYINGMRKEIPQRLCVDFSCCGRILSVKEMAINPIRRVMQIDYFYKFLKESPNTPQWYGYSKRNSFAINRKFEDSLYQTVVEGLESDSDIPVILAGQSSSGKSVALAALAYHVIQDKKYPVLFINNTELDLSLNTSAGIALDNILKELRAQEGRVLVILDWSVYNLNRTRSVRDISDDYRNRGHNVLFVASAIYAKPNEKRYRVIQVPSKLDMEEKEALKELMIEKAKLKRDKVERWMDIYSDDNGLLSMLYHWVYELRPQLERGIRREVSAALEDTKIELMELEAPRPIQQPITQLAAKLVEVGLVNLPDEPSVEETEQIKQDIVNSLQPFCVCVAVASLFRLRMPMTLAIKLLDIPECENRREYCNAVFNAPWMNSAMDDDKYAPGEYYVEFRDSIDARIYLNGIGLHERDQMKVVAKTIEAIKSKDTYYKAEVRFLERLIRMVGPNSDNESVKERWHNTYGRGCLDVLEALKNLRLEGIIEPQLIAQEITYIREYYIHIPDADLMDVIEHLKEAIDIARTITDRSSYGEEEVLLWNQRLIDSIKVESIFSELRLEEFIKKANESGQSIEGAYYASLNTYAQRRDLLMEIINDQPENSYPYTALLACFLSYYDKEDFCGDPNEKLKDMSDVIAIVDITESSVPAVEQNEHYQRYKTRFLQFFDQECSGVSRAEEYAKKLIEKGSAVGIHMQARAILRQAGVNYYEELGDTVAQKACQRALDILENPDYEKVVRVHSASQFLRLQLTWLIRNKKPIFAEERQVTYMNKSDWARLYEICCSIRNNILAQRKDSYYRATVLYIMALSCAQLKEYDEAINIWMEISEDDIYTSSRMRTWHVLSDSKGNPIPFTGTFTRAGLPDRRILIKEMSRPVLYHNLQSLNVSKARGDVSNLCIGTSYRGFRAFAIRRTQTKG